MDDLWASPPPPAPTQQLADWWPRVGAATIDFCVRFGIAIACAALGSLGFLSSESAGQIGLGSGIILGALIATFVYAPLMLARTGGQTVGHRVTETRVVMADGTRMSGGRGFVREALVKSILIEGFGAFTFYVLPLINYLMPLWDDKNETLHDKLCGTHVVVA